MANIKNVDPTLGLRDQHVDIQRLDLAWTDAINTDADVGSHVQLDLSSVRYLDQECLLYLVGLLEQRRRNGWRTTIRLPRSANSLDFLRAWSFPQAVEIVSGQPFKSFLSRADRARFDDAETSPPRYLEVRSLDRGGRESLLPMSFFALTPVALDDPTRAATLQRDKFLDRHFLGVLNRHFGRLANRVAANVVYECVLNAAMHPGATQAFVSCQLLARPRPRPGVMFADSDDRELVVAVWDDGRSFSQTLTDARTVHGTITSPAYGLVDDIFEVDVRDRAGDRREDFILRSTDDLSTVRRESHLTVAAFLLGVSSTPERSRRRIDAPQQSVGDVLPLGSTSHSGLGLHVVRKTVIDLFRGTLTYVTGSIRVNMSGAARGPGIYSTTVERLRTTDSQIVGNLLIARLRLPPATTPEPRSWA